MRHVLIRAMLAVVLASCVQPPAATYTTTIANPTGELPLPVTLGDRTGLVAGIGPATFDQGDFRDAGVLADPNSPNAFILTWMGGMCDNDAAVVFSSITSGYDLHLNVHEKLGGGCPAAGVLRGLRIATTSPIAMGAISISGDRTIQLILEEDCGLLTAAATGDSKVACLALITATIGEQTDAYASVTVTPADGACPVAECSTSAGIEAQPWRVDAIDRKGQPHRWQCTYQDEAATCTVGTQPTAP